MPAILNAANEEAVYAFLEDKIKLLDISNITAEVLNKIENIQKPSLDEILAADKSARELAQTIIKKL